MVNNFNMFYFCYLYTDKPELGADTRWQHLSPATGREYGDKKKSKLCKYVQNKINDDSHHLISLIHWYCGADKLVDGLPERDFGFIRRLISRSFWEFCFIFL